MHRDIELEEPTSSIHTSTAHQWGAHHVYSTAHEGQETDLADQSAKKPSILVRLHQALSGVRGTSSPQIGSRTHLANSNAHEGGIAPNSKDGDRAVFQTVLQKLSKSQPVADRLVILDELSDLVTR